MEAHMGVERQQRDEQSLRHMPTVCAMDLTPDWYNAKEGLKGRKRLQNRKTGDYSESAGCT